MYNTEDFNVRYHVAVSREISPLLASENLDLFNNAFGYPFGTSAEEATMKTAVALDYPMESCYAPDAFAAVLESARRVQKVNLDIDEIDDARLTLRVPVEWDQGIYTISYAWANNTQETRLYEIGFLHTKEGHLVVKTIQKHNLRQLFRSRISLFGEHSAEKSRADNIFQSINSLIYDDRYPTIQGASLFGLAIASAALGHSGTDIVLFPTPENHPEIKKRQQFMYDVQEGLVEPNGKMTSQRYLEWQIRKLMPLVDFPSMLSILGVPYEFGNVLHNYVHASSDDILTAALHCLSRLRCPEATQLYNNVSRLIDLNS